MKKILTIVIPAYNVEKFIDKCLSSFELEEVLSKIEVLIVNDGSTDKTPELAQVFCDKYPNTYRLINKENGGHGSTINRGAKEAKGVYFKVVDGDDWVDTGVLSQFITMLETVADKEESPDIVANDFICVEDETWKELERRKVSLHGNYGKVLNFSNLSNEPMMTIHALTIKTHIIRDNPVKLDEKCFYEDMEYDLYPIPYVCRIYLDETPLYQYRLGRAGQSVDMKMMQKRRDQHMRVIDSLLAYYDRHTELDAAQKKYMEKGIVEIVDNQYQIYLSMGFKKGIYHEMKAFDRRIRTDYPGVYKATPRKSIRMIRKSGYLLFYPGALVYRLLRG